jgi:flagellar hook protein FlgE
MFDVMSQAKNAIEAYNQALKVTSSNIANMSVPGYKKLSVSFQSIFEKVISQGTSAQNNSGGTNPYQLGQGVAVSATSLDFSNGETAAGGNLDLAIQGRALFIVSPDGGKSFLYSRSGNFKVDNDGNLNLNGMQVYGLNQSDALVPITGLTNYNTSLLSWTPAGQLAEWTTSNFDTDPVNTYTPYRIALTTFSNPGGLVQAQGTTFAATVASGDPSVPSAPSGATGEIKPRNVEASNVFYLSETIAALEIQRAMSGNLNMIKMASDMVSSFISKLT